MLWQGCEYYTRPAGGFATDFAQRYYLDAPCPRPVLARLLACAHIFATTREALHVALAAHSPGGCVGVEAFNPPLVPILGGLRAAMVRLIVGVDMVGNLTDQAPVDPVGQLPPALQPYHGPAARAADVAAGAPPPSGAPG